MDVNSKKQQEFVKLLEQAMENLEKQEQLSNEQIKGLFKTFLAIQIENSRFVDEMADTINRHGVELEKLISKTHS